MRSTTLAALATAALTFVSVAASTNVDGPCGVDGGMHCEQEGYICKPENPFSENFACVDDSSHYLFKRQSTTNIVGAQNAGGVLERLPIQRMMSTQPDTFNMFLYALSAMQAVPETNSLSYYQIAGIHGRPFTPWQEAFNQNMDPGTGYCTHGSALFATWHRPYLALIEQRIVAHARNLATRFAAGPIRDRWMNAASRVRLCYWDWAASDLQSSIPTFIRTPRITITTANSAGQPQQVQVANPLYQYTFTDLNLKNQNFVGVFRSMAATRRHPTADGRASQNTLADQQMRNTYQSRRQNTYNLFSISNFNAFSNDAYQPNNTPINWVSVESIHNEIHVNIGGSQGHMSLLDYSSFDPLFWLHHCMVDRLVAMYQAIHPNRRLAPQQAVGTFARRVSQGDVDDINTPLRPFRNGAGNYFTSAQLSTADSIWNLNYAYPEVPVRFRGNPTGLSTFTTSAVNSLYGPNAGARKVKRQESRESRQWICHLVFAPAEIPGEGASPECLVFLGNPTENAARRKLETNLIGSGSAFGRQIPKEGMANKKITSTIPLTDSLVEAGVDVNNVKECVQYLKDNLKWTIQRGDQKISVENVPSLLVGVSSAKVTYGSDNELPKWGEFETYYEATETKERGMTVQEGSIVKSVDVTHVLGSSSSASSSNSTSTEVASSSSQSSAKIVVDSSTTAARRANIGGSYGDRPVGNGKHSEYDNCSAPK